MDEPNVEFGNVIFGESSTQYVKVDNKGALPTKIYVKTKEGRTIPFISPEELPKNQDEVVRTPEVIFDEFVATVSFKRVQEIEGYSNTKI